MFELFKRGNHTICEAGTIDDVKARYADGTTPPDAGTVLHIVDPPSAWIWDANSSATEGAEAFAVGASETGRFLLAQATLEEWSASVDASGGTNGYVLAIDDGRIVAQTPGTPGPHTHDLDDINQPANLAAFNNWIGVTLDTTSDPRTPSAHNHGLSDITQPANLGAFNTWLGVTLDTSSDTRDPNPHQHDLDDIASPDNLAELNDWAGVTLDTASDPRDPNAHQHDLDDIEQPADLSEFNAWIGVTLDTASDPRDPNSHTHALSDVTGPNGITALNNWANTNMDNAGDPRPPEAHTQAISTINSFTLAQLNNRISNANLDAAGTARPPTSHTHPYTELTASGESDGAVLRVVDEEFEVAEILGSTDPVAVGGAPSAGTSTTAARSDHTHDVGRFDTEGVTVTGGVCPLASANGMATLMNGSAQTITSFGPAGDGCIRLVFAFGGPFTIDASASGIVVPGGEDFVLPLGGIMVIQGIPATNNWQVIAAWNDMGQPLFGLRQGAPNAGSVGGNPSISPAQASLLWAPDNHAHDIGKLGDTITVNSTGITLATSSGDVVALQAGSSSTVLNFGSNTGQRRVCVLDSDLTLSAGFGLGFPSGMLSTWAAKSGDVFIAQGVGGSNWYVIPLKYLPLVEGAGTMRVAAEPGGALNPISSSQGAVDFYLVNDRVTHSTTAWQSVVIPTSKHSKTIAGGVLMIEASVFSKPTSGNANASNSGYMMRRGIWFPGSTGSASLRATELLDIPSISISYTGERLIDESPKIWMEIIAAGVTGPNGTVDASNLRMFYQLNSSASREVLRTVKVTGIQ